MTTEKIVATKVETGLTLGQIIERFSKFKGEARPRDWAENEHIYYVTHNELCAGFRYGYGEYPGEPGFMGTFCKLGKDGQLELGWKPNAAEMFSRCWSFVNLGPRTDIYHADGTKFKDSVEVV